MNQQHWTSEIESWFSKRTDPEVVSSSIKFFSRAFKTAPAESWFGVHRDRISLVIGNIWIAAIALSPKRVDLLIDGDPQIHGLNYIPAPSTEDYVPLGWLIASPWDSITSILKSDRIWQSYARACEKILVAPVSKPRSSEHYRKSGKVRVSEISRGAKPTGRFRAQTSFSEGGVQEITMELQRRNQRLRRQAITEYGDSCQICGFNFGETYGEMGVGYIEVHHLQPLSKRRQTHQATTKDVAVVCANCHRILHRSGKAPMSVDELRTIIGRRVGETVG